MKVSHNWLQTFFEKPLPSAEDIEELFTFHSSEIDGIERIGDDDIFDVSVLPDKSAWLLSHRGMAKELSTILDIPLLRDPFKKEVTLSPEAKKLSVLVGTEKCARYSAAYISGVKVCPSPSWLKERLEAVGQRSINNIVDATNYVMFHLGQPLHAFDAGKLEEKEGSVCIGVREAKDGEKIVTLSKDEYTLTAEDMLIVDEHTDVPIGIAGVKGGVHAQVDEDTTDIVIESANFDRFLVRKTAQRHKLRTDASHRYENGVVPELTAYGLLEGVALIIEIAGGVCEGYVDTSKNQRKIKPVSVSLEKVNSVLGLSLSREDVLDIFRRFGYEVTCIDDVFTVVPPFERDDLSIPEDLVEEVGRMYGLSHVPSITPDTLPLAEYNKRFYYAESVREVLVERGFSEVYTSSFCTEDIVQLENALATDKGCMRSKLSDNLNDALARNVVNKDLLGLSSISIFEIGTVFDTDGEYFSLALGVRTDTVYKAKKDDELLRQGISAVETILGPVKFHIKDGVAEVNLDIAIADLPEPESYEEHEKGEDTTYTPFSSYPHISRDIALWVSTGVSAEDVEKVLNEQAGDLRVRTTLFDTFSKEGKTSYAFRLVFQSHKKTLTDEEVNEVMKKIVGAVEEKDWEVR